MIERKTVVDQIEIRRDGTVQIRFGLLLVEDGVELDCKWHRTSIPPNVDFDSQLAAVNAHLVSMGNAEVDSSEVDRARAIIPAVQTDEVKSAYAVKVEALNMQVSARAIKGV